MKRFLAMAFALTTSLIGAAAAAQGVCIDDQAKEALACKGTKKQVDTKRNGPGFHALPPPAAVKQPSKAPPPPTEIEPVGAIVTRSKATS